MYYVGFSRKDAYELPIWERLWYLDRLGKELKKSNEQGSNASKAAQNNTPDQRFMKGNNRLNVPAKLRRFT